MFKEATYASCVVFYDENNRPITYKSYQAERPKGYIGSTGWIPWDTEQDQGPLPIEQDGSPLEDKDD